MASTKMTLSLQEMRRRKGLSLAQIAEQTKIGTFFLEAIESEEYSKLPGGVFNRSYIRQYAAAIGVPEEELLEAYAEYEAERERRETATPVAQRRSSGLRWIASLLASAF